jgi:hypothetical protein
MVPIGLVFSIHDSTEVVIQKMMIEASQRMLKLNSQGTLGEGMSPSMKTLGIRNKDSGECSKRCRKIGAAFESKAKTKRRSNADGRHAKAGNRD